LVGSGTAQAIEYNEDHKTRKDILSEKAIFEAYPHMQGPRVDHTRRSLQKEFAPCLNHKETKEMYQNMINMLFENVPEIHTVYLGSPEKMAKQALAYKKEGFPTIKINAVAEAAGIKTQVGCMSESRYALTALSHFVAAKNNENSSYIKSPP